MATAFKTSLLGCFGDPRLCILTFCCPCYTVGKNAEGVGEDCLLIGLLCAVGLNFGAIIRWRLRQDKNLEGSMITDVLLHMIIPCCALIQEAKEIGWNLPDAVAKKDGAQTQEMDRA